MTIIDSHVALALFVVTLVAAAAAVLVLAAVVARMGVEHHRRRNVRHESIPAYYWHLALGH